MLILRSRRVVLPDGERPASLCIEKGTFADIRPYDETMEGVDVVDVSPLVLSPGVVDSHVHINDPGRADWEGFDTATRAAAAGGVTTLVDMPLNSIPATVDRESLDRKRDSARGRCHVDIGFWGGLVPGNARHIEALVDAGVRGFKCFLVPSGVDEFPAVDERDLRAALPVLRSILPARPLLVHAEAPSWIQTASGDPRAYATFLATRPAQAEVDAIAMIGALSAEYHVPTHIVHVSSSAGVAAVEKAHAIGAPMTAETCPHYLTFSAGDVEDGATAFKCAPPLRGASDREGLWEGLRRGTLSLVASDHSPAPPALKCVDSGDFIAAWGGIASLELLLPAVWTGAVSRGFTTADVARWLSREPARLAGLDERKGAIRVGADADLVAWDPDGFLDVRAVRLQQRHKLTPYEGRRLRGAVHATWSRGTCVWNESGLAQAGRGRLL